MAAGQVIAPIAMVLITSVLAYGWTRFRHSADLPLVVLAGVAIAVLLEGRRDPPGRLAR
jgi:hypothetical protein